MFAREDRAAAAAAEAAKWMLGALPGIKLMNPTAASGHHDTNTAWVATHARRKAKKEKEKNLNASLLYLYVAPLTCAASLRVTDVLWLTSGRQQD